VGVDVLAVLQPDRAAYFVSQIVRCAVMMNVWKTSNTLQALLYATYVGLLFNEKQVQVLPLFLMRTPP
jgi:hypothetical protein